LIAPGFSGLAAEWLVTSFWNSMRCPISHPMEDPKSHVFMMQPVIRSFSLTAVLKNENPAFEAMFPF
jgi:hypothetical protein